MDETRIEQELVDNPDHVLAWAQADPAAATPVLIDVLRRAPPDPPETPEEGRLAWTYDPRCHAAEILGALRAIEAIDPLVDLLAAIRPDDDELSFAPSLYDKLLSALEVMGPEGLEPFLARYYELASLRYELCGVLADLGVRDDRVFTILVDWLDIFPAYAATNLYCYGDVTALPHLSRALDACLRSPDPDQETARDLRFALMQLGGDLTEEQILGLLDVNALRG